MEHDVDTVASGASLRNRVPGQTVITELLRIQGQRPPQNFLARLFGVDPVSEEAQPWFAASSLIQRQQAADDESASSIAVFGTDPFAGMDSDIVGAQTSNIPGVAGCT